jgi:hypothetical protein
MTNRVQIEEFEVGSGSVAGREHYRLRRNNQDACWVARNQDVLVAVVCDGCGDPCSPNSEVGALVGARLVANQLMEAVRSSPGASDADLLEGVRLQVLSQIESMAGATGPVEEAVRDCFLFTVVGALVTPSRSVFFSLGDGMLAANGEITIIGPYPGNAPPYLAYALVPGCNRDDSLHFTIPHSLPTPELRSFLIGTDGVRDLISAAGDTVPGRSDHVGELSRFWLDDIYYTNPAALGNRLRLLNTDAAKIDWQAHRRLVEPGRLPDDTTLIVARRAGSEVCHA